MKLKDIVDKINEIDSKNVIGPWSAIDIGMFIFCMAIIVLGIFMTKWMVEAHRIS